MKTPQTITVGNRQYTVNPFEQYVLQFVTKIYTQTDGQLSFNNTLESLAPLLEVLVEEVCPEMTDKVGFNRALSIYFWKGSEVEVAEMVGGLVACHYRWQIQEFERRKLSGSKECLAAVQELNNINHQLQILREEEPPVIEPVTRPTFQNDPDLKTETLEELKAKIAALEAARL